MTEPLGHSDPLPEASVSGTVGAPVFHPGAVRNVVVTLRAHFVRPESYDEAAWEAHLEEVAKQVLYIGRLGAKPVSALS